MKTPLQLRADVPQHRAERDKLIADRQVTERAPVPTAMLEARVDALIAEALADENPFRNLADPEGVYTARKFNQLFAQNPLAAFARISPKGLKAAMLASVEHHGITPQEREKKLAEIDDRLFQTEIAEELTLREIDLQTCGLEYRRSDARPDIMLAPDEELRAATAPPGMPAKALQKAG